MELSDIILWILVGIAIGAWGFYMIIKAALAVAIRKLENEIEEAIEKQRDEKSIPCRVELHNDVFFVYNNDTNEFVAQGKDLAELRERIRVRWADKKVSVVAGEESVLEKLRAQI